MAGFHPSFLEVCHYLPMNIFNHRQDGLTPSIFNLSIKALNQVVQYHIACAMVGENVSGP
jgi:hypothetical protein